MIIDARGIIVEEPINCDACIIGAGPAGIVLAIELARAGKDIVLLESGGMRFEAWTNDLNKGKVINPDGHGPLEDYRRRRLGGASTAWGGRCVPFDEVDFEPRAFVPNSGWPFNRAELDPYYARAHGYLDLGTYAYDADKALPSPAREREMVPGLVSAGVTTSSLYLFSPPTNFSTRYRQDLVASPRVRLYIYANCLEILTNREGNCVADVKVGTVNGKRIAVHAKHYVLAAGGLEVTRLMLCSNRAHPKGIGNQHDLLGRYYMCHVVHHLEVEFACGNVIWDYEKTRDGVICQRTLSMTQEKQRSIGLLNHRARIEHPPIGDPDHKNGVLSMAFLAKWIMRTGLLTRYLSPTLGTLSRGVISVETASDREAARRSLHLHAINIVSDFPNVLRFSKRWLKERVFSTRKLPSMVLRNESNVYTLRIDAEQIPNPESRVTLGDDVDFFGQRRLEVDWRCTDRDSHNLLRTAEAIGQAISQSGVGRVRGVPSVEPKATGGHHIGTTRMANSASGGVV
ncbi:MAG TPA: FAD-dependent oxidoreductase, partial [Gemmata sp.]|nr:FAD-dependent oxidoreductase [Gemmata sp.]